MGITRKIAIGFLVPVFFYLVLTVRDLAESYAIYNDAERLLHGVSLVENASGIVHELQKERGLTAAFLSGGKEDALMKQRVLSDKVIAESRENLVNEASAEEILFPKIATLPNLRSQATEKPKEETFKAYTLMIKDLLNLNLTLAESTSSAEAAAALRSLRILEESKESGGKFRAAISSVFVSDMPLEDHELLRIINLRAKFEENILSLGLKTSDESRDQIAAIQKTPEWEAINSAFVTLIRYSTDGGYGIDGNEFFVTITKTLDLINGIIIAEKSDAVQAVTAAKAASWSDMMWSLVLSIILTLAMFAYLIKTVLATKSTLTNLVERIFRTATQLSRHASKLGSVSDDMSSQTNAQSSNIQTTATATDEISAMAARNRDSTSSGLSLSESSISLAKQTAEAVEEILESIKKVRTSSDATSKFLRDTNDNVDRIHAMIADIDERTKSINDIVFQTKLLSFNASVEAARAGVHGKGFAVVAEEVGKLAEMSGKSASNIHKILDQSVKEVEDLRKSSSLVGTQVEEMSRKSIEDSQEVVEKCRHFTKQLLANIDSLVSRMQEIDAASGEQTSGVEDISRSISSIDESSFKTLNQAKDLVDTSGSVAKEVANLEEVAENLNDFVNGPESKNN